MKLLTLNTHSLTEENYREKLNYFVTAVAEQKPDIIALQEVNQSIGAEAASTDMLDGYTQTDENALIRIDNHVLNVALLLRNMGIYYHWSWIPIKLGYEKYDEGIAIMSLSPITDTNMLRVTATASYKNYKKRKILGIRTKECGDEWFYSVHYGWYDDWDESFAMQWIRTEAHMMAYKDVWLMGDFNTDAESRYRRGYDMMLRSNWYDSYLYAKRRDDGITVKSTIDGWKNKTDIKSGMRIDQIWSKQRKIINSSYVIFNGKNYPVVSDHSGVIIEYERG